MLLVPVGTVVRRIPAFGAHPRPYGEPINRDAPRQRHVSNAVTVVNFDYRGFDTLGEEFMLVCAVTGAVVLLRGSRGEAVSSAPGTPPGRPLPRRSEAVVLIGRLAGPLIMTVGLYTVVHATTTPGGFVIIASALLLLFLGEGYCGWRRIISRLRTDRDLVPGKRFLSVCITGDRTALSARMKALREEPLPTLRGHS